MFLFIRPGLNICRYCGRKFGSYGSHPYETKEHIFPKSYLKRLRHSGRGNSSPAKGDKRNLIPVCSRCNNAKGCFIPTITKDWLNKVFWQNDELILFLDYLYEYRDILSYYIDIDIQDVLVDFKDNVRRIHSFEETNCFYTYSIQGGLYMWSALRDCSNVEIHLRDDKVVSGIVKDVQRESL